MPARGKGEEFHRVVFRKFYGEGQAIGRWEVLRAAAEEVGLDAEETQRLVEAGTYTAAVRSEVNQAHQIGVTGVPTYVLNNRYAIVGAQPYEVFLQALERLRFESQPKTLAVSKGLNIMEHDSLPQRTRPRPPTNKNMPHSQIGISPVPEVNAELFRRAYSLPNVTNRPTVISVPGARAIWLDEDLPLEHPESIARGREFAHIHPDGSLHVSLSPERAQEAIEKGWAEPHPLAAYLDNLGMVMLYTPLDMQELDVIFQLIVDSYNFVTGRVVNAVDIAAAAKS